MANRQAAFQSRMLLWVLLPLLGVLAGCQKTPPSTTGVKVGKPYSIAGKTYYPEYDPTYDKIGKASWYGPGFHGRYTASGEVYNQEDLTAAHPTLPMPSMVRVTNLANGKSVIVRVNDRGPFKSNRIIDLSKKAATDIGLLSTGDVRVQFLKPETEEYLASIGIGANKIAETQAINNEAANAKEASIIRSTEPPAQIVDSNVAASHAGQVVDEAAPVLSVSSQDLGSTEPHPAQSTGNAQPVILYSKDEMPVAANGAPAKQAWADARVPASSVAPPVEDAHPQIDPGKPEKMLAATPVASEAAPAKPLMQKSQYFIQAGSFSSEDNARKLSSRLSGVGQADVGKVEMQEKTWWRVRLGPFPDQQAADNALGRVRAANVPDARIVHQ